MRVGHATYGAAAAVAARPSGVRRFVDAVARVFAAPDTVSFTAVDGVFVEADPVAERPAARHEVEHSPRADAHRLYNARAGTSYVYTGGTGAYIDVHA